jgi:hypothetical protein
MRGEEEGRNQNGRKKSTKEDQDRRVISKHCFLLWFSFPPLCGLLCFFAAFPLLISECDQRRTPRQAAAEGDQKQRVARFAAARAQSLV